jgi:hypothetical protein
MNAPTKRSDRETDTRAATERTDFTNPSLLDALPTPVPADGTVLRWVAVGKANDSNEHKRRMQGYVPCKYGDFPDFYRHLLESGSVKPDDIVHPHNDLVLMKASAGSVAARRAEVERRTAAQMDAHDPRSRLATPGLIATNASREEIIGTGQRRSAFGNG